MVVRNGPRAQSGGHGGEWTGRGSAGC
jgi:hypothetical protein